MSHSQSVDSRQFLPRLCVLSVSWQILMTEVGHQEMRAASLYTMTAMIQWMLDG
jgi:hypothetical protein